MGFAVTRLTLLTWWVGPGQKGPPAAARCGLGALLVLAPVAEGDDSWGLQHAGTLLEGTENTSLLLSKQKWSSVWGLVLPGW